MREKSVIIAIPDRTQRAHFAALVERMPGFSVISQTSDLMNTYNEVEAKLPKAVLISENMADLPEFEVMRALFSSLDVRWLVVTSRLRDTVHYMGTKGYPKPGADLFSIAGNASQDQLLQQLTSLTRSEVSPAQRQAPIPPRPRLAQLSQEPAGRPRQDPAPTAPAGVAAVTPRGRLILIGSSTGGVDALLTVLSAFPRDCPPTLIVQHTGHGFGESLVGLLDRQCAPDVRLASGETALRPGLVVVGAGIGAHLVLRGARQGRAGLEEGPPVSGHRPSVDMLFRSALDQAGTVTAALLTGMGRDGADGLKHLRDAGARTIAQDEKTCVVYGMPRAAVENGAAGSVLPLNAIGPALLNRQAGIGREFGGMGL